MSISSRVLLALWGLTLVALIGAGIAVFAPSLVSQTPDANPELGADGNPATPAEKQASDSTPARPEENSAEAAERAEPLSAGAGPFEPARETALAQQPVAADSPQMAADTETVTPATGTAGATGTTGTDTASPTSSDAAESVPDARGVTATAFRVPALLEESDQGFLPRIGPDGRMAADVYRRSGPADSDARPRIALIITDMGQRNRATRRAFDTLPPSVTLAFSPYGDNLERWAQEAAAKGYESLMMVPMEPVNYPQNDPGPLVLIAGQSSRLNINLLRSTLSRMTGYVGVVNHMGSRFTTLAGPLKPVLEEIKSRGLLFVDSRSSQYSRAGKMAQAINMAVAVSNRFIDNRLDQTSIRQQLQQLERKAQRDGAAVGIGRSYPVTLDSVAEWAARLEQRGAVLVPISYIIGRQTIE